MGGCISLEIVVVYCGGAALIIGAGLVVYGGSGWNMCSICYSAVCIFVDTGGNIVEVSWDRMYCVIPLADVRMVYSWIFIIMP